MKYSFDKIKIKELIDWIDKEKIDLNPSYQRNFIWTSKDQKELIDTILLKYPLPNFFIYKKNDCAYEMVDGQQRSKTIFRFVKGLVTSSKKTDNVSYQEIDKEEFDNYEFPIVLIDELEANQSLNEFYAYINKKGVHLNPAEITKSEFHYTNFLKLANEMCEYQPLVDLNIFSEALTKRMKDRAFIEELLGYLMLGIKDKKKSVEDIYNEDITDNESVSLKVCFCKIIDIISNLNKIKPINLTRFKQKNDFYTLFNFINENLDVESSILEYQYKILLLIDDKDRDGRQHIRPTNEVSEFLKQYALNCVSQSNSKLARKERLNFFNYLLKNTTDDGNEVIDDILNYFSDMMNRDYDLKQVGKFKLINLD